MSYAVASEQQNINIKALAWTIGVHILLFLLFLLWKYQLPVVIPPVEMGMEVNLGTSDNGSGTDQPMSSEDPSANTTTVNYNRTSASSNAAKDLMQSNDVNAPAIIPANNTNNTNRANVLTNNQRKRTATEQADDKNKKHVQQQPRYVYNGGTGKGGNSAMQNINGTSEGNTTGPGDRGVPGGTPGSTNYVGSPGNGKGGISTTLSGRQISPDRFEASFHEGGTVKIAVTVDRQGNIVNTRVSSSPSPELSRLALQKLSQAKFSPSTDAQPQQFGTVTIVFKTGAN